MYMQIWNREFIHMPNRGQSCNCTGTSQTHPVWLERRHQQGKMPSSKRVTLSNKSRLRKIETEARVVMQQQLDQRITIEHEILMRSTDAALLRLLQLS